MLVSAQPVGGEALEREIEVGRVEEAFAVRDAQYLIGQLIDLEIHRPRRREHQPVMHRTLWGSRAPFQGGDALQYPQHSLEDISGAENQKASRLHKRLTMVALAFCVKTSPGALAAMLRKN
jgi:hypothetical protein